MSVPLLSVEDVLGLASPLSMLAKRIETNTHPDGVVVDIIMADGAPQTFRVVSIVPAAHVPAAHVTVGLKPVVVHVRPPPISNAR